MPENNSLLTISRQAYDAVIFDLDGVITKTAAVHAAAWKELFDRYLEQAGQRRGKKLAPFDIDRDYRQYVDGKPRYDGVRSFLQSRGLDLPFGTPEDGPDKETICGLGNKKNQIFHEQLEKKGPEVYEDTVDLLQRLRASGFKTAVISASKNCAAILKSVRLMEMFDAKVDGMDAGPLKLKGKPEPDVFLEAARRLAVTPPRAIVVEDALAGVQAGQRGKFGLVVGVDRTGHAEDLVENGANLAVSDLRRIAVQSADAGPAIPPLALERLEEIFQRVRGQELAVFLDYDGTLTPIVERPELAVLDPGVRQTLKELAEHFTVAVISGRDLKDVQALVGLESIFYAGSHGFDIAGPRGQHLEHQSGREYLPDLDEAEQTLRNRLEEKIPGVQIERKKSSLAVHYRRVKASRVLEVEETVRRTLEEFPRLRPGQGKKVYELQPDIDWHKGKALLWLLDKLDLDREDVTPLYVGDDVTDEDAFKVLRDRGIGIAVKEGPGATAARYRLRNPEEVEKFLQALITYAQGKSG